MVTTESMREFSVACLEWAANAPDPSNRQVIVSVARTWLATADAIDRYVLDHRAEVVPDMRMKLN